MRVFRAALEARNPPPDGRRWVYVPYDQLTDRIGPLAADEARHLGVVLVENARKASLRPYHKQKLGLVLANQRHFALEMAERGVAVRYVVGDGLYRELLAPVAAEVGGLVMMEAAERELRADLSPLAESGALEVVPHEGWLTTADEFRASHAKGPPWHMTTFYRYIRKTRGLLMVDGKPLGGKLSFDAENRARWRGTPPAPAPPRFAVDEITREVGDLIATRFHRHPGTLSLDHLPVTRDHARVLWDWAKTECLPHFGPYQDAMARSAPSLFHTRISALLHLSRLLPRDVLEDVLTLDLPIASLEGFVRQLVGWREFVRHVHRESDGFRDVEAAEPFTESQAVGDGGYHRWAGEVWRDPPPPEVVDAARPSAVGAHGALPPAYWGQTSGLACLDAVVSDVWETGYGHHITRLMVLANIGTLLDVSPRDLADWFWVAYTDAYDWVVEPNVLGMGTHAVGGLMTTKPYVSGAAYIDRMGDYCSTCSFDPKRTCPITRLYWAYLARHADRFDGNPRLALPLRSLAKRKPGERARDAETFALVRARLLEGKELTPEDVG